MDPRELREWRTRQQLSLTDLGKLLGVDRITVHRWETGVRRVPPFLHLALRCLEREGGGAKRRGAKP